MYDTSMTLAYLQAGGHGLDPSCVTKIKKQKQVVDDKNTVNFSTSIWLHMTHLNQIPEC